MYEIRRTESGQVIVFCPDCDGSNNWLNSRGTLQKINCTPVHYECDHCHQHHMHWREYREIINDL